MSGIRSDWLENKNFDLAFIGGCAVLALLFSGTAWLVPMLFMPLMLADLWLLGYHHVISTYTKMAGTAADRARNGTLIYGYLPLMMAITLAAGMMYGAVVVVTVYFFWQWFHYTRQSWGIAQRYRRKAGGMKWDDERIAEITLWAVPVWGVLNRCAQQPDRFLFLPVWMPPVPVVFVQVVGMFTLALVAWWSVTRIRAWQRGELPVGHTVFMLSHFAIFFFAYKAIPDINTGWLMANVWHNSQYVVFVWLHNRQRFAAGVSPEAPRLSWLSQPGAARAILYFMACIGISTVLYCLLYAVGGHIDSYFTYGAASFIVIFSMALNFHHYVVDGIIWKRRRDPAAPL